MPFSYIFLVISMMTFLRDFHVSSCDVSCTDKPVFTPSTLVVRFGDPTFASCSVCQHDCINNLYKVESPVGLKTTNGTTISWTVNRLTEWEASPICYYIIKKTNYQCCTTLPVTVYHPPDNVSISFVDPTGPMLEGQQCTLQCTVKNVAPVENLTVTFYRGRTVLSQQQSNISDTEKEPVTDIFSLNITLSKEDDGVQYWCEAKLELGPDGPQPPPVVTSQNITTTVLYGPQLVKSPHLGPNIVVKGDPLELSCLAVGNPSPSYTWTPPPQSTSTSNSSILTINSATFADEGKYTCSVSNVIGNVTAEFDVVVRLELTSTRLPPTTTPTTTTTSTTPTTTTTSTTATTSTTPTTTTTSTTATTSTTPTTTTTSTTATTSTTPTTTTTSTTATTSTTPTTTTTSTTATTSTTPTTPTTSTRATTSTTPTTTTTSIRATVLNCSTSSFLLHRFIMCFMLLFSALV